MEEGITWNGVGAESRALVRKMEKRNLGKKERFPDPWERKAGSTDTEGYTHTGLWWLNLLEQPSPGEETDLAPR